MNEATRGSSREATRASTGGSTRPAAEAADAQPPPPGAPVPDAGARQPQAAAAETLRSPWLATAALLLVPAGVLLLAVRRGDWRVDGVWLRLWGWGLAALAGALYAVAWRRGLRQAVGMAIMWVPVARTALDIVGDFSALATPGQVLPAFTTRQLSSFYIGSILANLGYLGAGFLLWHGPARSMRELAAGLAATGAPLTGRGAGPGVGRGEGRGVWLGFLLFPLLLGGSLAMQWLLEQSPTLVNSDERSIWDNMTPFHALLISAAAAVGEEAVYRVFLMTALAAILQRRGLRAPLAWTSALVLQAAFFGFAHAGYANWAHVIQAGLFGLVAGIAVLWLGVWVAITLHFLVDVYALGSHADGAVWIGLLWALLVTNTVATLVAGGGWGLRRLRTRRA